MFRHNRNETNKNKNITPTAGGHKYNPGCQNKECSNQNPFLPEQDTFVIEPNEEGRSNESFDNLTIRNIKCNSNEDVFFPQFIQRGPIYQPEFRATRITKIQTTVMDNNEDDEECECHNDDMNTGSSWCPLNMRTETPSVEAHMLRFTKDSVVMKRNLAFDHSSVLPQFATDEDQSLATSVPFVPNRQLLKEGSDDSGQPGANVSYFKEFGNLVARQLDNLETRFIVYRVKMRGSNSLKAILMRKKYVFLSIPIAMCLLWLMLLLGVLIGSVYCNDMEDCPWAKGTTMAPRLLYSRRSVF